MTFITFILFVILFRIAELIYSKRNEKWLLENGAVEYGNKHYPFIVMLHIVFIISVILEYSFRQTSYFSLVFLISYAVILVFKIWIILSLGKFWNTKIYRIHDIPLIIKGPYKYIKHPNYIIVAAEIALIPLAFHLYFTAIIFSILNAIMLYVRIKEENRCLKLILH